MFLSNFVRSYLETALWSSSDFSREDGASLEFENYGVSDIAESAIASSVEECESFLTLVGDQMGEDERAKVDHAAGGRDFWLTRNRHGAGFWAGGWEHGAELTELAHSFGPIDPYVSDDGFAGAERGKVNFQ